MLQKQKSPRATHTLPLAALLCLLVLSLCTGKMAHAAASADAAFGAYTKAVTGLNGEKAEDMQKAATAFVVYLNAVLPSDKKLLLPHMDKTLLVSGKNTKKEAVTQKLDAVLNDMVLQCVRGHNAKEPVFVRNTVDYMVGDGCIWFNFTDDNPAKPTIFAINNN